MAYDDYNREERSLCAHLFRLLHEGLASDPASSPLAHLLAVATSRGLALSDGANGLEVTREAMVLTEVALIRDAYFHRKPEHADFLDALVELVREQQGVASCRPYSMLPAPLSDHRLTHPRDIARKGGTLGLLSADELVVYGAVRGMFNAKPDLLIVLREGFVVFEAKFTERFDAVQLDRTKRIAQVWARLLALDLGYVTAPPFAVARLGPDGSGAELTWGRRTGDRT